MAKILIVDDEPSYREYLGRYLAREGHDVCAASSGRDAIQTGARFRPDVLVVDWMLKNHIHGLQVSEVLSAVDPGMATVLITGFPSRDLKASAERASIFRFVEKPFGLEEIRAVVDAAAASGGPRRDRRETLVVETDPEGRILYANDAARSLFRSVLHREDVERLADVFGRQPEASLAARGWNALGAVAGGEVWCIRTHVPMHGRSQIWLLRREMERADVPLTEMLLGVEEPLDARWPIEGRVLVVDDDELFRHVAVAILESAGAASYAVENDAEALRLLGHDHGIRVMVVDYEIPGSDVESLVRRARAYRPDLHIVGNSAFDRAEEFRKFGVRDFMRKPWRPRDLVETLDSV
jgi:DNA-binding NtrC family response regulator